MKAILFFLLTLSSLSTWAQSQIILIDYVYGNHEQASLLQIFEDGTISHFERSGQQTVTKEYIETPLTEEEIQVLKTQIEQALQGTIINRTCVLTGDSIYGSFTVNLGQRSQVIRSNASFGPHHCMATEVRSQSSDSLLDFVNRYVKTKLSKVY